MDVATNLASDKADLYMINSTFPYVPYIGHEMNGCVELQKNENCAIKLLQTLNSISNTQYLVRLTLQ